MRFVHKDIAQILAWLDATGATIHLLEWEREPVAGGFAFLPSTQKRRAAHPAKPATIADVARFAERGGHEQIKLVMTHYLHVALSATGRPLSLEEAVVHVENEGVPGECLLVGHLEGGLISVSRELLPFQQGATPADWWGRAI